MVREVTGSYPWAWTPADAEDFTVSLESEKGGRGCAGTHVTRHDLDEELEPRGDFTPAAAELANTGR
ncbi:hypothetical protein AB0B25_13005 [Nocardia sp. NPDC049190]|uniref:hypothetical protein n=1 Tax=Nocardia sp. NPDC049190 TaxID=3155650 RepID=UPI0033CC625D